jgi:hypothetical protein
MQWWSHCHSAFFVAVSETNAVNSRGHAKGISADPQLKFRKALAMCILKNKLNDEGKIARIVPRWLRSWDAVVVEHVSTTRPNKTGKWVENGWSETKQIHQKTVFYCGCNPRAHLLYM